MLTGIETHVLKGKNTNPLHGRLAETLKKLASSRGLKIDLGWVRSHGVVSGNIVTDWLAGALVVFHREIRSGMSNCLKRIDIDLSRRWRSAMNLERANCTMRGLSRKLKSVLLTTPLLPRPSLKSPSQTLHQVSRALEALRLPVSRVPSIQEKRTPEVLQVPCYFNTARTYVAIPVPMRAT